MNAAFYRLPATARALITGVLSSAAIFGVMSMYTVSAPWGDTRESVIARLAVSSIAGLLTGAVAVVFGDQRMHRIYGSTDQALSYSRALRTGELPTDIEPGVWHGWLALSRQSNKWAPSAVAMFALLAVLQILDGSRALAGLLVACAVMQSAFALVLRRRIARLAVAVDQRITAAG